MLKFNGKRLLVTAIVGLAVISLAFAGCSSEKPAAKGYVK